MGSTTEIELKYRYTGNAGADWSSLPDLKWLVHPTITGHSGPKQQQIRDTYWDTGSGLLFQNGFYIRSRDKNGKKLYTLKGPAQKVDGSDSYTARLEIEGPADGTTWQKIVDELASGVSETQLADLKTVPEDNPRLREFQPRENARTKVNVNLGSGLLEFAFDKVTYTAKDGKQVTHRELEVEIVENVSEADLLALDKAISKLPMFTPFGLSKVLVGMALEKLVEDDSDDFWSSEDTLSGNGYDELIRIGGAIKP